MPISGRQITIDQALAICHKAGFRKANLITAVAIMCAESGRFIEAYNINVQKDGDTSLDRGLFQINTLHTKLGIRESFEAWPNVRFAFKLSGGNNFTPWATFNHGRHLKFRDEVEAVFEEGSWRVLLPIIRDELA